MSYRTLILLLTSWLAVLAGSCSPVQNFYMKEKVTTGAPRHGIVTNQFLYGVATGRADALFVVDNSESGEAARDAFQKSYGDFIGRFGSAEARLLNLRAQVVTTPESKAPLSWAETDKSAAAQLAELFTAPNAILNYAQSGYLKPLTAAVHGLSNPAFERRGNDPLFLFFILGDDLDPKQGPAAESQPFSGVLKAGRGFHQTHMWLMTRTSAPTAHASPFPRCGYFFPAPRAVASLSGLPWRSQTQVDLCDPAWAANYPAAAFSALVEYKKRLVLSRVPYQPSTMLLRNGERLFRYGDDYMVEGQTNEIKFLRNPALMDGDLLEARYYLPPSEEEVLNNTPPPPISTDTPGAGNGN